MSKRIKISGKEYKPTIEALTLYFITDVYELKNIKEFENLTYLGLGNTNINDKGLKYISECQSINNLNLQCTEISDNGISHLTNLKTLKYLRLKECDFITNESVIHFNKMINLIDLQIHDTDIDQNGLQHLKLSNLEFLCIEVWNDNFSYDFLLDYSKKFPNCHILAKGRGEFRNGVFDGSWN